MKISEYIPSLEWIKNYKRATLSGDLAAGLTVGVMLIPQGMAYAMIAGLPPIYGLYASTIPLIIYSFLGTSRQLAVGPVAMVSLLTAAGVGLIASTGTAEYISLAITLAFLVGFIQFLLGAFKLGFLVNFLSHPVISGFTSAAAIIIGLSQLKHLLGVKMEGSSRLNEIVVEAVDKIPQTHLLTLLIGCAGIVIIVLLKKYLKALPGQLVAVVFGIAVVSLLNLDNSGLKIVGDIPSGLPEFTLPNFQFSTWQMLLPTAMAIALVSFMESIAVAKAIQAKHKDYKVVPNQELVSLGLANIVGSFFQAYPTTGGFSRTAVNDQAGAKTGLASLISAVLIILTLLFLTPLFYNLPQAILASVIMVAVFGLIDFKEPIHLWHANKTDFFMLSATFVATLFLGIEEGIGIGVVLSLVMVIYRTTRPHIAVLGKVPGTDTFRNIARFDHLETREDIVIVRFDEDLYFANINYFQEELNTIIDMKRSKALKFILLDAESINYIDSSAMNILKQMVLDYRDQGIYFYFAAVKGPVRDAMHRDGIIKTIGSHRFFLTKQNALEYIDEEYQGVDHGKLFHEYTLQTNEIK